MAITNNDELNVLEKEVKRNVIPIDDYFEDMEIDDESKDKRKKIAFLLYTLFSVAFTTMKADIRVNNTIDKTYYQEMISRRIRDSFEGVGLDYTEKYPELWTYSQEIAKELVDTSSRHLNEDFYFSPERAIVDAENETNSVYNYVDNEDAIESGNKYKTWVTMRDERVRDTHAELDGLKIGIYEMFQVGDCEMRFPHDYENGTNRELANCRCSVKYSKE